MILEGLYKIQSQTHDKVEVKFSDETHPVFQAHFPGNPILPGFVHIEIIEDVFNIDVVGIKNAKFTQTVLPLQNVTYMKNENKIRVISENKDIASFSIV